MDVSLQYIGANGNVIDLFHNSYFDLVHVDGLTGVDNDIASATTPSMDGDKVNSVRTQPRGIILDLRIKNCVSVEDAKRFVLRTIKSKQTGRLILHQDGRDVEISGVVESISLPRFEKRTIMQVSLYCPAPYWQDVEDVIVEIMRVIDAHYFPLDVGGLAFPTAGIVMGTYDTSTTRTYTNDGDTDCGMIITIVALNDVSNPAVYKADGTFIGVNDRMSVGDKIVINTNRGEKAITKNGVNILNKIKPGSTFIQLDTGDNELTIDTDGDTEGNAYFVVAFKRRFV